MSPIIIVRAAFDWALEPGCEVIIEGAFVFLGNDASVPLKNDIVQLNQSGEVCWNGYL